MNTFKEVKKLKIYYTLNEEEKEKKVLFIKI